MTTLYLMRKKCGVCGKKSPHPKIFTYTLFGPHDLDFRPPPLLRSTLQYQIEVCPYCGYSVPGIGAWYLGGKQIVYSDAYRQQLKSPEYPPLANLFLCAVMVLKKGEIFNESGKSAIKAAWVCDDEGKAEQAKILRREAGELLRKATEINQRFMKEPSEEQLMLTDIFRRGGLFLDALRECKKGIKLKPPSAIKKALQFEENLIKKEDTERHDFGEVGGDEE